MKHRGGGDLNFGILSVVVMLVSVTSISLLRPEYNHLAQSFSELGQYRSPYFLPFNLSAFVLVGIIDFIYFTRIKHQFVGNHISTRGIGIMQLTSLNWILTGLFPLSYSLSWLYTLHILFAFISYILSGLGTILIGSDLLNSDWKQELGLFSVLSGILIWLCMIVFVNTANAAISQLLSIGVFFTWLAIFSVNLDL